MVIVDVRLCHQAFFYLHNDNRPQWTRACLHEWQSYWSDSRLSTTAEAIKLSKVASTAWGIGRCEPHFTDLLKITVSSINAFKTKYGVRFSDARTNCVIDDMISSDFLSSDSCSTYVCHDCVTTLVLKLDAVLRLIEKLSVRCGSTGNHGMTYADDATVYRSAQRDVNPIICAAYFYVWSPMKPSRIHSVSFYKCTHLFLQEMRHSDASVQDARLLVR